MTLKLKLNLGCGNQRHEGYINVDKFDSPAVDVIRDLEKCDWPWKENAIDEAVFHHSLEHMGETTDGFFHVIKELYRVCKPEAFVEIVVPHPRHDDFMNDPTHVRPITGQIMKLFSKAECLNAQANGWPNTPLALMLGVDFEILKIEHLVGPEWENKTPTEVKAAADSFNNIIKSIMIHMRVHKDVA